MSCYCKNQTAKLIEMALFAKMGVWYIYICKSLDVEGISQKRKNIGVTTKDYKWIDGGTDLATEFGLARCFKMITCSA